MSVAIHPSETRPTETPPRAARRPVRLRTVAGLVLGGGALAAFTAGAFALFSGLADPRTKPVRVAPPVASQWPDLKDGVPALAEGPAAEPARISLPPAEPVRRAEAAPPPAVAAAPAVPAKAEPARTGAAAPHGRPTLPIEPVATLVPARAAAPVAPAKVAAALPPSRAETVRAKEEQPARFVSLPAAKAKAAKTDAAKTDAAKIEAAKPAKAEAARKPAVPARRRVTEADTAPAAPSPAAASEDEPEVLGVKIPGGRQIRAGWDAAVGGLLGGKDE